MTTTNAESKTNEEPQRRYERELLEVTTCP